MSTPLENLSFPDAAAQALLGINPGDEGYEDFDYTPLPEGSKYDVAVRFWPLTSNFCRGCFIYQRPLTSPDDGDPSGLFDCQFSFVIQCFSAGKLKIWEFLFIADKWSVSSIDGIQTKKIRDLLTTLVKKIAQCLRSRRDIETYSTWSPIVNLWEPWTRCHHAQALIEEVSGITEDKVLILMEIFNFST